MTTYIMLLSCNLLYLQITSAIPMLHPMTGRVVTHVSVTKASLATVVRATVCNLSLLFDGVDESACLSGELCFHIRKAYNSGIRGHNNKIAHRL